MFLCCSSCLFLFFFVFFFFSSRRRHTRWPRDWSSDVCSSDLAFKVFAGIVFPHLGAVLKAQVGDVQRSDRTDARSARAQREIGRASCRERVEISGGAGALKKKKK